MNETQPWSEKAATPPFVSTQPNNKHQEHCKLASNPDTFISFWKEQSKLIDWYKEPTEIFDNSNFPLSRWFKDGVLSTSYNCLDRHIKNGASSEVALIYESPFSGASATYTYAEVLDHVSRFAGVLQNHGIKKGDRVIVYMPMIPEAVMAIHGCARIGAVHSVVFGGFASPELAKRIKDCQPKLIITASCGYEPGGIINYKSLVDEATKIAQVPDLTRIVVQRDVQKVELRENIDFEYYSELAKGKHVDPVPMNANDPLYILYTSGTTGNPKGILRQHGGHAVAMAYSSKHVIDIGRRDVFFSTSDIGSVGGHTFTIYGPWITGGAAILFEGKAVGTPDAGTLWRICDKHNAKGLFTYPTAIRAIRKEDPEANHMKKANLSNLRTLFATGERLDTATYEWIKEQLPEKCLMIGSYGQTESGTCIGTNFANLHSYALPIGCSGAPPAGMNVTILDEEGKELPNGSMGAVTLKYPLPPGFASTLYNNDEGFKETYMSKYPGYYVTQDLGYIDEGGIMYIVGRVDDLLKIMGHRVSTMKIEEILSHHKDVIETAVIGAKDSIRGERAIGFIVLKQGVTRNHLEIEAECIEKVKETLGRVAMFDCCIVVDKLPKNKNTKILRLVLKRIANGEDVGVPPTIEDITVIDKIKDRVKDYGLGTIANLNFVKLMPENDTSGQSG